MHLRDGFGRVTDVPDFKNTRKTYDMVHANSAKKIRDGTRLLKKDEN